MYPEYLHNNDTQEISDRVCELAENDESTLRAQCTEVSYQTDTSSLTAKEECIAKTNDAKVIFAKMAQILNAFSQSLAKDSEVFRTRDGQADFGTICRRVTEIEEERLHLLSCITALTELRQTIFSMVADANRVLHFLKLANRAVSTDLRVHYTEAIARTEDAYSRLTEMDATLREVQDFYMTFIERHLRTFMERLRTAADFNHAGAALDRGAILALCSELRILINRAPNITF